MRDEVTSEEGGDSTCEGWEAWKGGKWALAAELGGELAKFEAVAEPIVYFPTVGSFTQPLDYSFVCKPPGCGPANYNGPKGEVSVTIESSITFSAGSEPISPQSPGPVVAPPETHPTRPPVTPEEDEKLKLHEEALKEVQRAALRTAIACGTEVGNAIGEGLEVLAAPTEVGELAIAGLMPLAKAAISGYLNSEGLSFTAQCHEAAEEAQTCA